MRAAGASSLRRRFAVATLAGLAFVLASGTQMRAQSEPPVPVTESDTERTAATAPSSAPSPATSARAIAESPSAAPAASPSESAPTLPEITTPAIESSEVLTHPQMPPQTTQIIPPAAPSGPPQAGSGSSQFGGASSGGDVQSYQEHADQEFNQQLGTLREFVAQGSEISAIGAELVEARRKLNTGQEADGLIVMSVQKNSPAARAGLKPMRRTAHNVLTGAILAGAMVFPPAILALPVIDYTRLGESYDMIIGVDGNRVTNFIDFENQISKTRPGELVYLSVVRDGKRVQIVVSIPSSSTQTATE